jgi:D-beta-D-heptose 7-phosphate kinase / D-beta-D-heptose 1-phosphate adenosyltransferase
MNNTERDILPVLNGLTTAKIAVVGDVMLDHYLFGNAKRMSAEAPIPVIDLDKEEFRLGGAGNVARNLVALGASVDLCSVLGNDQSGHLFAEKCQSEGISPRNLIFQTGKVTTHKMRLIAMGQQLSRVDRENTKDIKEVFRERMIAGLCESIGKANGVIIQDYNKGVLSPETIAKIMELARSRGIPVFVDPKFNNLDSYHGVRLFKPNRNELSAAYGRQIDDEVSIRQACRALRERLECNTVVATLSEDGMAYLDAEDNYAHLPAIKREVRDTSGAGDTVISVLAASLASGAKLVDAALVANHAASIVCGRMGTATVSPGEILESFRLSRSPTRAS